MSNYKNKTQKKSKPINNRMNQSKKKENNSNRNFKFALLAICIFAILVSAAIFLIGEKTQEKGETYNVYFLNNITKKLEPEPRVIANDKNNVVIKLMLDELIAGPKSTALSKTIADYVSIKEVKLSENSKIVEVQFSENYKEMSVNEELFCRAALVWTLTELDFVEDVHIYIGEEEALKDNGEPMGLLNRENVLIQSEIPPDIIKEEVLKIYFTDKEGLGLVSEERIIEVSSSQAVEKYIVEQIVKGPISKELYRTIPIDTKINDVRTDEGICYVDFTVDFITKFEGGSTAERLAVYSVVNSLTELKNVKKVQFLVEGSKVSEIKGHLMDISLPFERNEDIITE